MLDTLITGGTVVTAHGAGAFDVGLKGDKIELVGAAGSLPREAQRTIDASGRLVIPGGIDPHTHCAWPLMQERDGEALFSAGPEVVSRAALHGGTTTLIDFAVHQDGETLQTTIDRTDGMWKGVSYCDFAYHTMLFGRLPDAIIEQIPEAVAAGHPSVKIFTTDVTPSRRGRKMDFGSIWATFEALARAGGIAAVHAEDDDIVMFNYDRYIAAGKTSFEYVSQVHSTLSEDLSFRRVIRLAEHIEGAALYMMHVSAASGVDAIAEARGKGLPVYGETLHQYALYNEEDYKRVNGQIYHTYPSLKSEQDRQALWRGMEGGAIGTVATDAICTPLDVKVMGERIDDLTGGSAGVEPRIGVVYSEAVTRRGYSLERFVDLVSTNAARYLGLYPQKGVIAPGSDADIAILRTGLKQSLRAEDLHETDYSPWAGTEVSAWPVTAILRGEVVVEDGEFLPDAAGGQWVPRRISRPVLDGSA